MIKEKNLKILMLIIAVLSLIRSWYLICVSISILIRFTNSFKFIFLVLFVIFEEYCILSCLVKRKEKLIIEIEFSIICFFYIFSTGYTIKNFEGINLNLILTCVYVVLIEIYKILYIIKLSLVSENNKVDENWDN